MEETWEKVTLTLGRQISHDSANHRVLVEVDVGLPAVLLLPARQFMKNYEFFSLPKGTKLTLVAKEKSHKHHTYYEIEVVKVIQND